MSKKKLLVIHGGTTFTSGDEFRSYLSHKELTIDDLRPHSDWKASLQQQLGEQFDVLLPRMPNKQNASYIEWSIWFSKILAIIDDGAILAGHSLGGIFLAKYFAEHEVAKKVQAVILVAAPSSGTSDESLASFALPSSLEKFATQVPVIHLFYSSDDPVVPLSHAAVYERQLPRAFVHKLHGYGHFNAESFPEFTDLIRTLI